MLTIICALSENNGIGYQNKLLFRLKTDLLRFKTLTVGNTIVMGRRTFESLPHGALPHRRNLVLTASVSSPWPNTEIFSDLHTALAACREDEEIFVIGGESVYQAALPLADRLYLTHVHALSENADAFFPEIDFSKWHCIARKEHAQDAQNEVPFTFADYIRI